MEELYKTNPHFEFLAQFQELLWMRHDPWTIQARIRGARSKTLALSKYKEVERCYSSAVNALDVSPGDGRFLLSGGGDGTVVVHGVTKPSSTVQQVFPVVGKLSPRSPKAHKYAVSACQFYPPDRGVFVTSGKDETDQVKIWDTNRMEPVHKFSFDLPVLDHHMSALQSAKPLIAVAGMDKTTRICDIRTVQPTQTLGGHLRPVTSVRWSRHNIHVLATGGADGKIILWDVRKGRSCLAHLDCNNKSTTAANAAFVNLAHETSVISLEFSEDATHMVSYGADHRLRLWSTVTDKNQLVNYGLVPFGFRDMTRHLQMALSCAIRPDLIFLPSGDKILIFDMLTGVKIATLTAHFGHVMACAYNPNTQFLFSGASDRNILLWAPASDYKDLAEEEENARRRQLERSNKRIAGGAAVATQLQMDTWSDDEG